MELDFCFCLRKFNYIGLLRICQDLNMELMIELLNLYHVIYNYLFLKI